MREDGADYRGTVSKTRGGQTCQLWSHQWPHTHVKTHANYPSAGLGGHNHCRNPDGDVRPWCFTSSEEVRWDYCEVPAPSKAACGFKLAAARPPNVTAVKLNEWVRGASAEHEFHYFIFDIPLETDSIKVVVVPESGDPDMFMSFDNPRPTGANFTFSQETVGVDVFEIGRNNALFCGQAGPEKACKLYISILGWEKTSYDMIVYGVAANYWQTQQGHWLDMGENGDEPRSVWMSCHKGCHWHTIGDGICNPQCNNAECFWDRHDCDEGATGCKAACHPEWIGDGYCDEACFNAACKWDKRDCLKKQEKPCADDCMPSLLADGECDLACNTESCNFDEGDCFHNHDECYHREEGTDYRGTVATTAQGLVCQKWSEQFPHQHTRTHANYPRAGLGGHNYCRNPDGEKHPWCYTIWPERWDFCDVGNASKTICISPPPPAPIPCSTECSALGNDGKCDLSCNTTACLWDQGDCADILSNVLKSAKMSGFDKAVIGEAIAGSFMQRAKYGGIILGVLIGIVASFGLCYIKYAETPERSRHVFPQTANNA